jgi:hypothetical protein
MRLHEWRDDRMGEAHMEFVFTDFELVQVKLDPKDKYVIESPRSKENPMADALQNAQIIAFRLEQQGHVAEIVAEVGS